MRLPVALAVLLVSSIASAAPPATIPHVQFEKVVLPNGLQVILHVDKKLPLVHVNLWRSCCRPWHARPRNDSPARTR
jgi:hypothetical protein